MLSVHLLEKSGGMLISTELCFNLDAVGSF